MSPATASAPNLLGKLETLIVSDILPNQTTALAHYLLPGCAHAEKRGSFTNTKGRVQRFMKAVEPQATLGPNGNSCTNWFSTSPARMCCLTIEGLFNQMAKEVPAFNGLSWAGLGDGRSGDRAMNLDTAILYALPTAIRALQRGEDTLRLLGADVHRGVRRLGRAEGVRRHPGPARPQSRGALRPLPTRGRRGQGVP